LTGFRTPAYTVAPMAADPHRNDAWEGMGTGWAIASTLLGGILVWGGVGYLLDRLWHTGHALTAVGFVVGAVGGIYLVYLRYGRGERDAKGA
jgi:F0F1-type ATP synthase assembly protein I